MCDTSVHVGMCVCRKSVGLAWICGKGREGTYSRTHLRLFLGSGGSRAARIASSNTFFKPFCGNKIWMFKTGPFPGNKYLYQTETESGKREHRKEAGPSKCSFIQLTLYNTCDHMIRMKGKEKLMESWFCCWKMLVPSKTGCSVNTLWGRRVAEEVNKRMNQKWTQSFWFQILTSCWQQEAELKRLALSTGSSREKRKRVVQLKNALWKF